MSNNPPATKTLRDSWLTIKLLAQAEPSFTEAAIRNHVFNAASRKTSKGFIPGNGLEPHIRRVGSKVLINHGGFLSWIDGDTHRVRSGTDELVQNGNTRPGKSSKRVPLSSEVKEVETKRATSKTEAFANPIQEIDFKSSSKQGEGRQP